MRFFLFGFLTIFVLDAAAAERFFAAGFLARGFFAPPGFAPVDALLGFFAPRGCPRRDDAARGFTLTIDDEGPLVAGHSSLPYL